MLIEKLVLIIKNITFKVTLTCYWKVIMECICLCFTKVMHCYFD